MKHLLSNLFCWKTFLHMFWKCSTLYVNFDWSRFVGITYLAEKTIAFYFSSNSSLTDVLAFENKDLKIYIIMNQNRQMTAENIYFIKFFVILKKKNRNFQFMLQRLYSETDYSYLTVAFYWHNEQFCDLCSLLFVIRSSK